VYSCSVSVVSKCREHIKKNPKRCILHSRIETKATGMEKGRRDSETSSPTRLQDPTSSRFLDSFQGMFHSHESLGSEENKQMRLLYSELLSAAKKNIHSQLRTRDGKSWALAHEDKNYGRQQEDTKLASPFLVNTENKDCSFPAKRNDVEGEMAAFESAAQAVSNRVNKENNFKMILDKHHEKRGEDFSDEPAEKRRKEDAIEDKHTSNGPRERETYWERRRKNNASAKKSRDARKTRELQTQIKAAFLERENLRIHAQLMIAQQENACLKRVLCAKM